MIRFSTKPFLAKDEWLVEATVSEAGNDAALVAVFNSQVAAEKLASLLNFLAKLQEQCDSCD